MRAIVQRRYGSPDVLALEEIEVPVPRDGEVRVRVRAAAVNVADWLGSAGRPYVARAAFGLRRPKRTVPGTDVAGVVEAVGAGVERLDTGDEVFGWAAGSFAEYVCGAEPSFERKPANLTFEGAAAAPLAGCTALRNLRDVGRLRAGQRVLVNGASGGVGTFAVQIAKALEAEVTGVCSSRNVELVRSLGADHVIDYSGEDFTRAGPRYDLILDNVMNHPLSACLSALTPGGMLILNNGTGGGPVFGTLGRMARAMLRSRFAGAHVRLASLPRRDDLAALRELLESGKVRPVIDRTFPLSEAADAMRLLGGGHAQGKVVITI